MTRLRAAPASWTDSGVEQTLAAEERARALQERLRTDTQGHLASLTDALGRIVSYSYDEAGRVTTQQMPDGRQVQFSYGPDGQMTALTPPGRPPHQMGYNGLTWRATYVAPPVGTEPSSTVTQYDAEDALQSVAHPDGLMSQVGYDSGGRVSTVAESSGTTTVTYTQTGNVAQVAGGGRVLRMGTDGPLRTLEEWAGVVSGTLSYGYDSAGRVAWQKLNGRGARGRRRPAGSGPKRSRGRGAGAARRARRGLDRVAGR